MTAPSLYRTCPHRHLRSVLRRSLARLPGPSRITSRRESSRVTFTWTKKGVAAVLLSFPFTIFFYYISYDCITNERETTPTKRQRGIYDYLGTSFSFSFWDFILFRFSGLDSNYKLCYDGFLCVWRYLLNQAFMPRIHTLLRDIRDSCCNWHGDEDIMGRNETNETNGKCVDHI